MRDRLRGWKGEIRYRAIAGAVKTMEQVGLGRASPLHRPVLVDVPEGKRVLVLAPHMDDEVFGCGGTLIKLARQGARLTSVYLTDGTASEPAAADPAALGARRKEESRAAAEVIGIADLRYFDYRDRGSWLNEDAVSRMAELLAELEPELVMLPFFIDYHPDHLAANRLLFSACASLDRTLPCYCYECVNPIIPNRLVEITQVIEQKRRAMSCFGSQLASNNYLRVIADGLNRFRSHALLDGEGYAEAFFAASSTQLAQLLDQAQFD
jgi:LmbE family N-acetylglucosaminyl deacetylase